MISSSEIQGIIKEQEAKMQNLFKNERIVERELSIPDRQITLGIANIITGPRRCGKSVLALLLAKKRKFGYINFDDERLTIQSSELNSVLEAIYTLKGNVSMLVFDEIQEVEGWEKFASRIVNSQKLILTGSNSRMLSKELSTYLTGRHIDRVLLPFSFREFINYREPALLGGKAYTTEEKARLLSLLESYLELGGFPLALKAGREFLVDLYKDMIERDVVQRYKIRHASKLSDLARYLLSNSASEISYSKLMSIFGVAGKHTIKQWISYLENAYVLFELERFSFKLKESVMAPKKVYGIDTGLVNAVSLSTDVGRAMECAVAIELLRRKHYWFADLDINYWKSHQQEEADFIIRKGRRVMQILQVTYASNSAGIRERELKGIARAAKELRCSNLLVITWDYGAQRTYKGKKIKFMPLWKWLLSVS